jgi:hypothetical protein
MREHTSTAVNTKTHRNTSSVDTPNAADAGRALERLRDQRLRDGPLRGIVGRVQRSSPT